MLRIGVGRISQGNIWTQHACYVAATIQYSQDRAPADRIRHIAVMWPLEVRIRPPPVRDNCAEVRASAHHFGEKTYGSTQESLTRSAVVLVFCSAFPFSRYEMGPEKPLYQFVTK